MEQEESKCAPRAGHGAGKAAARPAKDRGVHAGAATRASRGASRQSNRPIRDLPSQNIETGRGLRARACESEGNSLPDAHRFPRVEFMPQKTPGYFQLGILSWLHVCTITCGREHEHLRSGGPAGSFSSGESHGELMKRHYEASSDSSQVKLRHKIGFRGSGSLASTNLRSQIPLG